MDYLHELPDSCSLEDKLYYIPKRDNWMGLPNNSFGGDQSFL